MNGLYDKYKLSGHPSIILYTEQENTPTFLGFSMFFLSGNIIEHWNQLQFFGFFFFFLLENKNIRHLKNNNNQLPLPLF